jgi:Uncharacterized protein conserved in bacteria
MEKFNNVNWGDVRASLDARGFVHIPSVLSQDDCSELISLYTREQLFRSTINMQRYRFGQGEYKYFNYPLPEIIQSVRERFYPELVSVANDWMNRLGEDANFPDTLGEFLARCHAKEQLRPTPLILRYEVGGYNTLHQDIYGDVFFPFQIVFMLTQPGKDYEGGELVFVEQLPRAQSRAEVILPEVGDAVIFTTNFRPVKGSRGFYRARMKHGVSAIKKGIRFTMGVIFHDAN